MTLYIQITEEGVFMVGTSTAGKITKLGLIEASKAGV